MKKTKPEYQALFKQNGLVMDIWGVAIKEKHLGKRLLNKFFIGNVELGIRTGYQYGFTYATNYKTGVAISKLGFEKIGEL